MNKLVKPVRLAVMVVVTLSLAVLYLSTLYKLQIVEGAAYYEQSRNSVVTRKTATAARGDILDRYGRLLVTNRPCNNLLIDTNELFSQPERSNAVILDLVRAVEESGDRYIDDLPITMEPPFEYVENMTDLQKMLLDAYFRDKGHKARGLTEGATAVELMAYFRDRYEIDNSYTAREMRIIAGVRYAINVRYSIDTADYVFAQDVSIGLISKVLEKNIPGVVVDTGFVREYKTPYASHILGYTAPIDQEEVKIYEPLGYPMDAMVGRTGVEKAFESYLHGVDGQQATISTATGTTIAKVYTKDPQPGGNIYLTLDIDLQGAAEQTLESYITKENQQREKDNAEAEKWGLTDDIKDLITGGAVVAVEVATGEPLAIASYPGFNLATFLQDYTELSKKENNNPLFNRALDGTYAPGSTFKMATALTAMAEGKITNGTTIYDEGIFTKYADKGYAPKCWIYGKGASHGSVNVTGALEVSCNYFFYTIADMIYDIDVLADYAKRLGLGVPTGIELDESTGVMPTKKYVKEVLGEDWRPGDTLQTGIGQLYSRFTPLQLAEYVAAVANGGDRHTASLLKEVRSSDYGESVYSRDNEILESVEAKDEYYQAIWDGMYKVANAPMGTAYGTFYDYPIKIAAKTGTAESETQVSNNAVFVCYAPADDPQIAVAVVVEKGGSGSAVARIARGVLDYYFAFTSGSAAMESEMTLLK